MKLLQLICCLSLILLFTINLMAQDSTYFHSTELLGRFTNNSVTINVLPNSDLDIYFEYGFQSQNYTNQTESKSYPLSHPVEVTIDDLEPNTQYFYRMRYRLPDSTDFKIGDEHSFHTQRPEGSKFIFVVHGDPHLPPRREGHSSLASPGPWPPRLRLGVLDRPRLDRCHPCAGAGSEMGPLGGSLLSLP